MSALSVADVLEGAADLIEPEGKWTQGAYARDMLGNDVNPHEDFVTIADAECWCMYGAIAHVVGPSRKWKWYSLKANVDLRLPDTGWNDSPERTQAEVVAKLREAAAPARATPPEGTQHG